MLKQGAVDSINNQLEDIDINESQKITLHDLDDSVNLSPIYISVCISLVDMLNALDNRVQQISLGCTVTVPLIYLAIKALQPDFEETASILKYRLINFLCNHLQAERIALLVTTGESRRREVGDRSKSIFQLEKICRDLQIASEELEKERDIITLVNNQISLCLMNIPQTLLQNPPRVLQRLVDEKRSLSDQQKDLLSRIEESFYQDFFLRRQMLMKRLDVTIQSFLWGEKGQGKEGEIVAAIRAQREYLSEIPTRYNVNDALIAPISLLHESSKRVTDQGNRRGSLVKSIIIGTVPDRGGRANEMRPKALSSGGNSGRGGGGGGGGRGNHHNVGRGGGRNKSSDSNKRQQVDHGKQGGRESKVSKTTPVGVAAVVRADVSSDHS